MRWLPLTSMALLLVFGIDLATGLIQARAPLRTWLALLGAPWYVPWKVWIQLRALASLRLHVADYGATPRG
jgi:hypothetical protein